jgi:hypothetical protein
MRLLFLVSLVACSAPASHPPDARPDAPVVLDAPVDTPAIDAPAFDLSCLGQPPPSTAPDPLPIAGKVFAIDHYQVVPVAGATVVLHRRADDGVVATAVTGSDGAYAMSIASGGKAFDGYYIVTATGELPSRIDPGDPLTAGANALAVVATAAEIQRWYADAGATYTAAAPTLIAAVVDCQHAAVSGSTIAIAPTAPVTYYDGTKWNPTLAASANGFALVPGAAATESITAAWQGHAFPARPAAAPASTLSLVLVTPYR